MHKQLLIKKILRYTRNLLIFFFASTLLAVIVYRFMPVYVTPLMVIRSVQQIFSGDKPTWKHTWVSFDKISPNLPMAVSHRTVLVERTNHGSLSQLYRNGKWHLRRASYRKGQIRNNSCPVDPGTMRTYRRYSAQSDTV